MDPISMFLNAPRMAESMNRVMTNANKQMTDLSDDMLKVSVQTQVGKEMGKGELVDLSA